MTTLSKELPYDLPKNPNDAVQKLAHILKIPTYKLIGDPNKIVTAMAGTILYRHLSRLDKMSAMKQIKNLDHPQLQSELSIKCLDVMVNPQWAEWSLSNSELIEILNFHNQLNRWSSVLGANPGAYGVGGASWSIIKQGSSTGNIAVLIASIILIGLHEFSYNETQKYSTELERRKVFN